MSNRERQDANMRFKLDFIIDRSELNADYRRYVLSFIKNALSQSVNGDLLDRYYTDTNTKDLQKVEGVADEKDSPTEIYAGQPVQCKAEVTSSGEPDQSVTWSVSPATAGVTISSDGPPRNSRNTRRLISPPF